ncbi:hypothetical protein B566_EDAN018846, partial [Ephemera danica]
MAATAAVLGAAAGAGLALLVAMTLVLYRYYAVRRHAKEWSALERLSTGCSRQQSRNHQHTAYAISQQ